MQGISTSHLAPLMTLLLLSLASIARGGELPRAEPEAVGLSAGKLAELKPALQKLVDEGKIPGGVVVVARHGKVAYETTFGYRDLASKSPMTEDTIFAIASMTKPITCVAVMMLVEQGKLGLDDPVEKYLPELKDMRVLGDAKDDSGERDRHRARQAADHDPRPAFAYLGLRLRRDAHEPTPAWSEAMLGRASMSEA